MFYATEVLSSEKVSVMSLTAPMGHGKTHFVKVLSAALAAMFPEVIIGYISANSRNRVNRHVIATAALVKACPELQCEGNAVDWRVCLSRSRRRMMLFVDELQNWMW